MYKRQVQADAGADMQMEAAITKTQPEKGVLALADVKIGEDVYKRQFLPCCLADGKRTCADFRIMPPQYCFCLQMKTCGRKFLTGSSEIKN